jgi:hypothetical protein
VIQTIINRLFLHPAWTWLYTGVGNDRLRGGLRGADLRGVDFYPIGLNKTRIIDWQWYDLRYVNLTGAGFKNTKLILKKANLRSANLSGADLSQSDDYSSERGTGTPGADLSGAILKWANLTGACLKGVKFTEDTNIKHAKLQGIHAHQDGFIGMCNKFVKEQEVEVSDLRTISDGKPCFPDVGGTYDEATSNVIFPDDEHTLYRKKFWESVILIDNNGELVTDECEKCRWFHKNVGKQNEQKKNIGFGSLTFGEVKDLALEVLSNNEFERIFTLPGAIPYTKEEHRKIRQIQNAEKANLEKEVMDANVKNAVECAKKAESQS